MFIYATDLHLRDKKPRKRIDNYLERQFIKFESLLKCSKEFDNIPIVCAGDFFDTPSFSEKRMGRLIEMILDYDVDIYSVFGQHDIANHNMKYWKEGALGNLILAELVFPLTKTPVKIGQCYLYGCSWGEEVPVPKKKRKNNILVTHKLVTLKDMPFEGYIKAADLMQKFPEYSVFLCGDNHVPFSVKNKKQILLNAGSMMRNNIDQIEHNPFFYICEPETNNYTAVLYDFEEQQHIFDLEALNYEKQREETKKDFSSLVNKIKAKKTRHNFKDVLNAFIDESRLNKDERIMLTDFIKEAEEK
jgi:DNA repair exonuclease SbcCD nuclease subunit